MKSDVLRKFFAVTINGSIYHVSDHMIDGQPMVKKIAGDKVRSPYIIIGGLLQNGHLIGITGKGICMFDPHPKSGRKIDQISTQYWGGNTSPIVALFLTRAGARLCWTTSGLTTFDERFIEQTRDVLGAIGDEHPVFEIADSVRTALMGT